MRGTATAMRVRVCKGEGGEEAGEHDGGVYDQLRNPFPQPSTLCTHTHATRSTPPILCPTSTYTPTTYTYTRKRSP